MQHLLSDERLLNIRPPWRQVRRYRNSFIAYHQMKYSDLSDGNKNWPTIGIDVSGAFPLLSLLIQSIVSSGKCLDTESSVGRRSGRLHAYVSQGTAMLACVVVSFSVQLLCYTEWTQYKTGKCIGWKIRVSWRGSGGLYPYVSRGTMQQYELQERGEAVCVCVVHLGNSII